MILDLTQLKHGESGKVVEFRGGSHFMKRIHALGIREGKKITKVSSHFWRGPQTVKVENMQFAIGFGMAKRIMVDLGKA